MRYLFGAYTLDTPARTLRRADAVIPLEPKAYHVLLYLIEQRQRQVTRTELLEHVWADAYVNDSVESRCIVALRRALGDSPETQQTIQTRRGYGYRFVAPVVCQEEAEPAATLPLVALAPLAEARLAASAPALAPSPADALLPPEPVAPPTYTWTAPADERKVVTVLCCCLSATAAAVEALDLDEQHSLLQDVFAQLIPEAERYGATLQPLLARVLWRSLVPPWPMRITPSGPCWPGSRSGSAGRRSVRRRAGLWGMASPCTLTDGHNFHFLSALMLYLDLEVP